MPLTITQVDAFTSEPFGGNPAAVCLLPRPADAAWMQRVAREMNLSETAFLVPRDAGWFDLRWFTPASRWTSAACDAASAHVLGRRVISLWGRRSSTPAPAGCRRSCVTGGSRWTSRQSRMRRRPRPTGSPMRSAPNRPTSAGTVSTTSSKSAEATCEALHQTTGVWGRWPAGSSSPRGPIPAGLISCRASSPRAPASTRIRSRGPRTLPGALLATPSRSGWFPRGRRPPAAASSRSRSTAPRHALGQAVTACAANVLWPVVEAGQRVRIPPGNCRSSR